MSEEEPAWRAQLGEALQRIAWDIERGNGIQGGMDYARQDLESTVLDAIEAAEQRGRREALTEAADLVAGDATCGCRGCRDRRDRATAVRSLITPERP